MNKVMTYARQQFIPVIHQIEIPEHVWATLPIYPELGYSGEPYEVKGRWEVFNDLLMFA